MLLFYIITCVVNFIYILNGVHINVSLKTDFLENIWYAPKSIWNHFLIILWFFFVS